MAANLLPAQAAATPPTGAAAAIRAARPQHPAIDAASALAGDALVAALRTGGLVLYLRHTETGAITEQCEVSNLSAKGAAAARELGRQLKQSDVPIGRIRSSPVCRVQETARLTGMGEVELANELAQVAKAPITDLFAARTQVLATPPRPGTNTLLVSHMHGGVPPHQRMDLEFGEIIVFRPDGKGGSTPVARIRAEQWPSLASVQAAGRVVSN